MKVLRCLTLLLLAAVLTLSAARGASKDAVWLRVSAPEFTLVTSLGEKEAVAWAGEFSQFVGALAQFIPVDKSRLRRLTIVVFARERDFADYRSLGSDGKPQGVAGFFSHRDSWAIAGLAGSTMGVETKATIFHEGTHWFLSAYELPNPVWLEEGLAEVFSTFTVNKKTFSWGQAIDQHVLLLARTPPMPLERLMFLAQDELFRGGREGDLRTGVAYAQSWAFVHYLVFGQHDLPPSALGDYVRNYRTAVNPDQAFRAAFGRTYAEMDQKLAAYLRNGTYYTTTKTRVATPVLEAHPATALEVEDALARLCLGGRRGSEALLHAEKAVALAGDEPRSFELLGEVYLESNEKAKALDAFQKAIDKGSRDFRPYYEIAFAEHSKVQSEGGAQPQLNPEDARRIANRYERAINFYPRFLPAYQNLAGVIGVVPPDNHEDIRFLELGKKLYPDDGLIRLGLAAIAKRTGDEAGARALLDSVLTPATVQPAPTMDFARRLDAAWRQAALFEPINQLINEQHFAQALALVDEHLQSENDFGTHQRLSALHKTLTSSVRFEEVRVAWSEQRWADARRLLGEIADSDAPALTKLQARKNLEELDRKGLGKPK